MKVTLKNDYHNTEATLIVKDGKTISASQVKRAKKTLCGINGCTCSNDLGMRGLQDFAAQGIMDVVAVQERDGSITARVEK